MLPRHCVNTNSCHLACTRVPHCPTVLLMFVSCSVSVEPTSTTLSKLHWRGIHNLVKLFPISGPDEVQPMWTAPKNKSNTVCARIRISCSQREVSRRPPVKSRDILKLSQNGCLLSFFKVFFFLFICCHDSRPLPYCLPPPFSHFHKHVRFLISFTKLHQFFIFQFVLPFVISNCATSKSPDRDVETFTT